VAGSVDVASNPMEQPIWVHLVSNGAKRPMKNTLLLYDGRLKLPYLLCKSLARAESALLVMMSAYQIAAGNSKSDKVVPVIVSMLSDGLLPASGADEGEASARGTRVARQIVREGQGGQLRAAGGVSICIARILMLELETFYIAQDKPHCRRIHVSNTQLIVIKPK
jgi:hypothetical protein